MERETGADFYARVIKPLMDADVIAQGFTREQIEADEFASRELSELISKLGSMTAAIAYLDQQELEQKSRKKDLALAS